MSTASSRRFHAAILLTAVVSALLAGAGVALKSAGVDVTLFQTTSPALWSARTFLTYFDVLAFLCFVPCWLVVVRFERKVQQSRVRETSTC
jgi:hypothetical protein